MDAAKTLKNFSLLGINFLFSFTVSNYSSPEIDLVKSPVFSLKVFCSAYCLGYVVLNVISSSKTQSSIAGLSSTVQQRKGVYIISSVCKWFVGIFFFHCLAVLYGAALSSYVEETFMWSVLMSCLVVLPCLLVEIDDILRIIAGKQKSFNLAYCLRNTAMLTLAGAWFGAFTLPLDWDRDWQVWPIPCAAGAMVGHFLSVFIAAAVACWEHRKKDKNKFI